MRTIWQSLAWKEWHEHKWKFASVTAIVIGVSALPFFYYDHSAVSVAAVIAMFCIAPLAVFIGAGVATGERARGTLAFTQALPVLMWRVGLCKLFAGLLTCVMPMLISLLVITTVYYAAKFANVDPPPEISYSLGNYGRTSVANWFQQAATTGSAVAVSIFIWSAAVGVNRKDEVSAAALALASIVAWWAAISTIPAALGWSLSWQDAIVPITFAGSPGGFAIYATEAVHVAVRKIAITMAIVVPTGIAVLFLKRFGRIQPFESKATWRGRTGRKRSNWLDRPRKSPLSALAWKQCRESGPIALTGLAGSVATTCLIIPAAAGEGVRNFDVHEFLNLLAVSTVVFGILATLVVGIGVVLNDLSPKLHTFWRSRPIDENLWFWTKFAVGLVVLAATFITPLTCAALVPSEINRPSWNDVIVGAVLLPLWIYSAAIMTTVLVRQAIYAGILSVAAMYLSMVVVVGIVRLWKLGAGEINWKDVSDPTRGEMAATMILASIVFTAIAWLAVRNDWGRKSRY